MSSYIDIIIPVHNEPSELMLLVKKLHKFFLLNKISYRLIIVDDYSDKASRRLLRHLTSRYPIKLLTNYDKQGKANAQLRGFTEVTAPYVALIDSDFSYSGEVLTQMMRLTQQYGLVVAHRNPDVNHRFHQWFARIVYGLNFDVFSDVKIFKRDIATQLKKHSLNQSSWDVPLFMTALDLGHAVGEVGVSTSVRRRSKISIKLISSLIEIGGQIVNYRLKSREPLTIQATNNHSMMGAGLAHRGKRYVTHTTLQHQHTALQVTTFPQKLVVSFLVSLSVVFLGITPLLTAKIIVAILSFLYFADVFFNLFLILRSLHKPPEITITPAEIKQLHVSSLPMYTILCPLYKEAHILPHFLEAIEQIDWPKSKLDVILLFEVDDEDSIETAKSMSLPSYVSVRIVPESHPKTKPKACNYGLHFAKGKYLVIYDAEDKPDPLQLKKVYTAFQQLPTTVKCIQAKLNFYNPHQNLLTRFFTAEYSLWFGMVLTGLQSVQTVIPLGGTSNHFRTQELKELEGWDPFNVTEDCDLGVRLFKRGALTAMINSVTLEEANSNWHNWLRQRSRWIKGYMQTYLVHMRHPLQFVREHGVHALLFQLTVGGKIAFMLINPLMWLLTISYFALNAWLGPTIESFYPSAVFYMAVTSLIFGNFLFLYYYMIGAARSQHWSIIKWSLMIPVYWLMVSIAASIALYQLIVKPHYWEKTLHGLHLQSQAMAQTVLAEAAVQAEEKSHLLASPILTAKNKARTTKIWQSIKSLSLTQILSLFKQPVYQSGLLLIIATLCANLLNMATNFFLGQALSFEDFGRFNFMISFVYLCSIPIQALGSTITYKSSYLLGKYNLSSLQHFWKYIHNRVVIIAALMTIVSLLLSPWLARTFTNVSVIAFIIFASFWVANLTYTVNHAYLSARLMFLPVAFLIFVQPLLRLLAGMVLAQVKPEFAFVAVLIALYGVAAFAYGVAKKGTDSLKVVHEFHLPRKFFWASLMAGLATISYFSLDNLLVAYLTTDEIVGQYSFMGLFGKMVFFAGSLSAGFLIPLVARREGAGQRSHRIFALTLLSVVGMTLLGYGGFIVGAYQYGHLFFGDKITAIKPFLLEYGLGIAAFTVAQVIVQYHLTKKQYVFPVVSLLIALVQIIALLWRHHSLAEITWTMTGIGLLHLGIFVFLHMLYPRISIPLQNFNYLWELFDRKLFKKNWPDQPGDRLKILIFNWRDQRHVWAGGAEVYVHQIAQRLVKNGHRVTIFCGNDGHSPRYETIDGVQIIRRGGFYTVYFWGFIYYIFRLRQYFDVIIDCENGIPFLTPLFTRTPLFLLIFHIHRDVFRKHLFAPLAWVARAIEEIVMPLLYRDRPIITISDSTKAEIMELGITDPDFIHIINPGIETATQPKMSRPLASKTKYPSLCYIGRLKPWKNVDTAIRAFNHLCKIYPTASFTIAGSGESESELKRLVEKLGLEHHVEFRGRITEEEKNKLYAKSWIAVQPSMMEGWGITVIEANYWGTPVIASAVNGLKDSVQHGKTGLLVNTRQVEAWGKAMTTLISDQSYRHKLSRAARLWARKFSWDKATEKMEALCHQQIQPVTVYETVSAEVGLYD